MEKLNDFIRTDKPEIHAVRRKAILKHYPEIRDLYVKDPLSAVFCVSTMLFQYFMVGLVYYYDFSWFVLVPLTWIVSGSFNHSLTLSNHELSHSVWLPKVWQNEALAMATNFITGFPSAMTFKHYHLEHHTNQGVDGVDVDLPTDFEGKYVSNFWGKVIFMSLQPFVYSFRPMLIRPKQMNTKEMINWSTTILHDVCVFYFLSGKCLFYLMAGSVLGTSLHPLAGHFISEHYVFAENKDQETYSCYDKIWNWFVYNTGFHNEHHDFPQVPGRLLPKVKAMAPEYYDSLVSHDSWAQVYVDWLFKDNVGCFNRMKRSHMGTREAVEQCAKELNEQVKEWQLSQSQAKAPVTANCEDVSTHDEESAEEENQQLLRERKSVAVSA